MGTTIKSDTGQSCTALQQRVIFTSLYRRFGGITYKGSWTLKTAAIRCSEMKVATDETEGCLSPQLTSSPSSEPEISERKKTFI
jgi:hypothetical protein